MPDCAHVVRTRCGVGARQGRAAGGHPVARGGLPGHGCGCARTAPAGAVRVPPRRCHLRHRRGRRPRLGGRRVVVPALPAEPPGGGHRTRAGHPLLRPHRGRAHHEGDHRDERHLAGPHGTAVRAGTRLRRHRRLVAGGRVRPLPLAAPAGGRTAAEPHRPARVRLQLVAGGRGQRVPQRRRGHRGGAAQDGVVDGVEGDPLRGGPPVGGVHHLRRAGHHVRDLPRRGRQSGLQDHPLPGAHGPDELLLPRTADARPPRRGRGDPHPGQAARGRGCGVRARGRRG